MTPVICKKMHSVGTKMLYTDFRYEILHTFKTLAFLDVCQDVTISIRVVHSPLIAYVLRLQSAGSRKYEFFS